MKPLSHLDTNRSRTQGDHTFAEVSFGNGLGTPGWPERLSALYTLQKVTERHVEGSRKSCEMAKSDFARTALQIGDVDLMNTTLLGEVDLPPTILLSKLPDSFTKLDADIRGHSSSIDLVEALYLVDALSGENQSTSENLPPGKHLGMIRSPTLRTMRTREEASTDAKNIS